MLLFMLRHLSDNTVFWSVVRLFSVANWLASNDTNVMASVDNGQAVDHLARSDAVQQQTQHCVLVTTRKKRLCPVGDFEVQQALNGQKNILMVMRSAERTQSVTV
jgi:hypothetical protein